MKAGTIPFLMLLALGLSVLPGYGSCEDPIIENPGFDIWCGDRLCGWTVEEGGVERVSTWHERDFGVALIGDRVSLSQFSDVSNASAACITFDLLADADEGVDLELEMDFFDDGVVEYRQPIPADDWHQVRFDVTAPEWYSGVRFRVRKTGQGRAVLAHIQAVVGVLGEDCTADPIDSFRPDGAECGSGQDCVSGSCSSTRMITSFPTEEESVCGECVTDGDCPAGQACGMENSTEVWMFRACGPQARHVLGEACTGDAECTTGLCCEGQCAECCPSGVDCPGGATCARLPPAASSADYRIVPFMCAPGEGNRLSGEPCLGLEDCESGICQADEVLQICDPDGRRCTVDSDCPLVDFGALCVAVGGVDGVCQ